MNKLMVIFKAEPSFPKGGRQEAWALPSLCSVSKMHPYCNNRCGIFQYEKSQLGPDGEKLPKSISEMGKACP